MHQPLVTPEKILVVDDEPDLELLIRQKFRKSIRSNELAFLFAGDGVEALEQLEADPDIGVVLTDINMPRMDGLTLLSNLAAFDRVLRAVVVSAYGDMSNIRTAMNRGAFDFVTKPVDFDDLETTIRKSLRELQVYKKATEAQRLLTSIQKELDVARRIQEAALPRAFPRRDDVELYAYMIPAREVGGDFYDFFFVDEDRLGFVMGDVSGKGVSAAMFMTVCRTLLKALALKGAVPETCVRDMNRLLYPDTLPEMFVTVFYGVLDTKTGEVAYCNAGHNPPYVLRADGGVAPLARTGGIAVCLIKDFDYRAGCVSLAPGDGIVLYTDGVTEAMDHDATLFSDDRLEALLGQMQGAPSGRIIRRIVRAVADFADDAPQSDDITALALRYRGAGAPD